nr:tail fiber protein [uncultured Flavobacterium sp.]
MKKIYSILFVFVVMNVFSQINSPNGSNYFAYNGDADVRLRCADRGIGGRAIVHLHGNVLGFNYNSDFTGGTKIGNDVFFKDGGNSYINSGNFGIGTTTPSTRLECVGNELTSFEAAGFYNTRAYGNSSDKSETRINLGKIEGITRQPMGAIGAFPDFNTDSARGSLAFYTRDSQVLNERLRIVSNGNVGIGTTNPTSKLTVAGDIHSREVKVTVDAGADFVFEKEYNLPTLDSVDNYIKENKHLPEIASAKEMQTNGINLSEMNIKLLQKVEEQTLYIIEMNKQLQEVKKQIEQLKKSLSK